MARNMTIEKYRERILQRKYSENRMVSVTDCWCGNYEGNTIKLSIKVIASPLPKNEYRVIIMAAGNDDFWMKLERKTSSCEDAISIFKLWKDFIYDKVPEKCNQQWFYEHGFLPS